MRGDRPLATDLRAATAGESRALARRRLGRSILADAHAASFITGEALAVDGGYLAA
jgi:hypothetical protein